MLTTDEKSSLLYKHYLGVGESRITRDFFEEALKSSIIVQPSSLWTYGDLIPGEGSSEEELQSIKNLGKDGTSNIYSVEIKESKSVDVVKKHIKVPLTKIDNGTDNSFKIIVDSVHLKNIIPFNFYEDYYLHELYTQDDKRIYFGAGDWFVDSHSGVLTFYGDLPEGVDHDHPPLLSFFEYVGGTGFKVDVPGLDSVILPINNFNFSNGSCVFNESEIISNKVIDITNTLSDRFLEKYKWDGNDTGPGIAISFEKLIPIVYSSTKNNVFAFEESNESQVFSLVSTKKADNENILFTSQKTPKTFRLNKTEDGYSVDDGLFYNPKDNGTVKIYSKDESWWIVVKENNGSYPEEVTVLEDSPSMILLYWDENLKEYLPWTIDKDSEFNTGIPVVCYANTVPPSAQLNQVSIGSFNDNITPDYYGPRVATIVVASDTTSNNKSADYIVKDENGYRLNDILNKILDDYKVFTGKIILRSGRYYCENNTLDISNLSSVIIEGEDLETTILGNITVNNPNPDNTYVMVVFNNLTISGSVDVKLSSTMFNNVVLGDVVVNSSSAQIRNSILNSLRIERDLSVNPNQDYIVVDGNIIYGKTEISSDKIILRNSRIDNLEINNSISVSVIGNHITFLNKSVEGLFLEPENFIINKGTRIDNSLVPFDGDSGELPSDITFPIYFNKEYFNTHAQVNLNRIQRKYTKFGPDFPINYDPNENKIELVLDHERIVVDDDGRLTTIIEIRYLNVSKEVLEKLKRHPSSELATPSPETPNLPKDEVTGENTVTNLEELLKDIYYSKADLYNGKVPIEQLPDSVAYGGLLYVGNWSFEKSKGKYPTFQDVIDMGIMDRLSRDENVSEMQPGWFFIIDKSVTSTHKVENINKHIYEASPSYHITISFDSKGKSFRLFIDKTKGPDESIKLFWSDDNYTNYIASYINVDFNEDGILWDSLQVPEGSTNTADSIQDLLPWDKTLKYFTFAWRGNDVTLNGALVKIEGLSLEENDDPIKEQHAIDGRIYTAGDWLIYSGIEGSKDFFERASIKNVELNGTPVYIEDKAAGKNLTDDFKRLFSTPGNKADLRTSDNRVYRLENIDGQITVKYGNLSKDGVIEFKDDVELLDSFDSQEILNIVNDNNAEISAFDNKLSKVVFLTKDNTVEVVYNTIDITPVKDKSYTPTYIFNFATNKARIKTPIYYDVATVENFIEYDILDYSKSTGKFKLRLSENEEIIEESTKSILEQFGSDLNPTYFSKSQVQFPLVPEVDYQYSIEYSENILILKNESLGQKDYILYDVLSNANNWEKLDRSYDDPVYSILPSHTASRNSPNIPWHWRDGGLGAEDLGNQTIVEALDTLNKSIKKLEPKKPFAAKNQFLKLVDVDKILKYREFTDSLSDIKEGLDKTDESLTFKVTTGEKGRDASFYIGDSADVTISCNSISHTENIDSLHETNFRKEYNIDGHNFEVVANDDLYDDSIELYGNKGFWKSAFINGTLDKNNIIDKVSISFSVENIRPDVKENLLYNSVSIPLEFNVISPLSLERNEYNNISATISPEWNFNDITYYLNGVRYIKPGKILKFVNLRIKGISNKYISENNPKVKFWCDIDDNQIIEINKYSIIKNEENEELLDIIASEVVYELKSNNYQKDLNFYITFTDFYGVESEKILCCTMKLITSDYEKDDKFVLSGIERYPNIDDSSSFSKEINNNNKLNENEFELLNTFIDLGEGKYKTSFKWPAGVWTYNNSETDYDDPKYKKGLEIGEGDNIESYRFITMKYSERLEESNGFVIKINTEDNNWEKDLFSGKTKGVLIQACITEIENGKEVVKYWFDCNEPMIPFADLKNYSPENKGYPAMFAGSSSSTEKRVSFGRDVVSGNLYVRIGITNEKSIDDIEVIEVV